MPTDNDAFPTLDADDLALLDDVGTRRPIDAPEYLYRAGDTAYDFFVIVARAVDIVLDDDGDGNERVITRHRSGRVPDREACGAPVLHDTAHGSVGGVHRQPRNRVGGGRLPT